MGQIGERKAQEVWGSGGGALEKFLGTTPLGLPENALSIEKSGLSVHSLE